MHLKQMEVLSVILVLDRQSVLAWTPLSLFWSRLVCRSVFMSVYVSVFVFVCVGEGEETFHTVFRLVQGPV